MSDTAHLLRALQHGDSAFPSGGFAFSWGLETLKADGHVTDGTGVADFVRTQLRFRWATSDRHFLHRASVVLDDREALASLDRDVEALTLATELRDGSRRAGRTLLRAHAGIKTPGAVEYQTAIKSGGALGHLPIAQAIVWTGVGLSMVELEVVAAYTLASGITQAAVRLSLLGPVEAQAILTDVQDQIIELLDQPVPDVPHAFTPSAEVAVMRHEAGHARLFAN